MRRCIRGSRASAENVITDIKEKAESSEHAEWIKRRNSCPLLHPGKFQVLENQGNMDNGMGLKRGILVNLMYKMFAIPTFCKHLFPSKGKVEVYCQEKLKQS